MPTPKPKKPLRLEDYLRRELPAFRYQLGLATYEAPYIAHLMRGAEQFINHLVGKQIEKG